MNTEYKYVLDGHTPVPCADVLEWAQWYETANRIVASTQLHGCHVSTVFLGLAFNFLGGPPILFETMIFCSSDCELHHYQERCCTWDEAELMHERICDMVRSHFNESSGLELSRIYVDEVGNLFKPFIQSEKNNALVNRLKNFSKSRS